MSITRRTLLIASAALAGCQGLAVEPEAEATAKRAFQLLQSGDEAGVRALMEPAQRQATPSEALAMMRGLIPEGPPPEPRLTSWRAFAGTGGRTVTLEHVYDYPGRQVIATALLAPGLKPQTWWVRGFNINVRMTPDAPAPKRAAGQQI